MVLKTILPILAGLILVSCGPYPHTTHGRDLSTPPETRSLPDAVRARWSGDAAAISPSLWNELPRYRIEIDAVGDVLRIELELRDVPPSGTEMLVPGSFAGMHALGRALRDLKVRCDGKSQSIEMVEAGVARVGEGGCAVLQVGYRVLAGPGVHPAGSRYAPRLGHGQMLVYGQTALVVPRGIKGAGVEIVAPGAWRVATSWRPARVGETAAITPIGDGREVWSFVAEDTAHLLDSVLAGGQLRLSTRELADGRQMRLLCAGTLPLSDAALESALVALASAQAVYLPEGWVWPPGTAELTVVALGSGAGVLAGSGRRGGLVLELGEGAAADELAVLIGHELFHTVNGHLLVHRPEAEFTTLWFKEGVTSWIGLVSAARAGLIDEEAFLDAWGTIIGNYYENPLATRLSAWQLADRFWKNPHARRLPYDKGALVGMMLDVLLRDSRDGRSGLARLFQSMLVGFGAHRAYNDDDLRQVAAVLGPEGAELDAFWSRFVIGAEPLPLRGMMERLGVRWATEKGPAPYYGFRLASDPYGQFVSAVDPRGPAALAGLRKGDRLHRGLPQGWEDRGAPVRVEVLRGPSRLPLLLRAVPGSRELYRVRQQRGSPPEWRALLH